MSYAKVVAKIILAAMGIYFIIRLIPQVFQVAILISTSLFSWKSLWPLLVGLFMIPIIILLIWYFFFYLRDWLAEKIVGIPTGYESEEQVNWFPAALRLCCMFAGLYCLVTTVSRWTIFLYVLRQYTEVGTIPRSIIYEILNILLTASVGIYFIFGAPHFVQWQVKKTIEQCKKLENSESALD
ncbi:MAG: hypothetical protein WCZ89_09875 [Phycisphaerae bacterium]